MSKITLLFAVSTALFAEQPQTAPKTETITLSADEQAKRKDLDQTQDRINAAQQVLNLQYDQLRTGACWRAGLKPEECGMWITSATVQKIVKAAVVEKPKATEGTK